MRGAEFRGCGRRKFHTRFQLEMLKFLKVDQNRTKIEPKGSDRDQIVSLIAIFVTLVVTTPEPNLVPFWPYLVPLPNMLSWYPT